MYLTHFGLTEPPFSIAPDPRFLYMSPRHQEALAHLLYGLREGGGFVVLTGDVGAGKTTICRSLLAQVPAQCDVALLVHPKLSAEELLATIGQEFGFAPQDGTGLKAWVDALNRFLLDGHAAGRQAVLIVDEAQNLTSELLEQLRLLTNLETNQRKLLHIMLIGQPELQDLLARPELRQLAQRVVACTHLGPLAAADVPAYVRHRLQAAGVDRPIFSPAALRLVARASGGVPRIINLLCDRALLGAFVKGDARVDAATVRGAVREVMAAQPLSPSRWRWAVAAALLLASLGLAWWLMAKPNTQLPSPRAEGALTSPPMEVAKPSAALEPQADIKKAAPVASTSRTSNQAAASPAAPAQASVAPLAWPEGAPIAQSRDLAFAALFSAWGVAYPVGSGCRASAALTCRTARGSLDELRRINRPALLMLRGADGREFHATWVAESAGVLTLIIGARRVQVTESALATVWQGRYTLLWKAPPGALADLRAGASGPAVRWLAERLNKADGVTATVPAAIRLDEALTERVRRFQWDQGLPPSGQLGVNTLLQLSVMTDDQAPQLSAP